MTQYSPRTARTSPRDTVAFARALRHKQTEAEHLIWEQLRNRRLGGFKFRRQHPIGSYIADFFCAEAGLVVELDGSVHDGAEQANRDRMRDLAMNDHGLRVIRICNRMVFEDTTNVLTQILELLRMMR